MKTLGRLNDAASLRILQTVDFAEGTRAVAEKPEMDFKGLRGGFAAGVLQQINGPVRNG